MADPLDQELDRILGEVSGSDADLDAILAGEEDAFESSTLTSIAPSEPSRFDQLVQLGNMTTPLGLLRNAKIEPEYGRAAAAGVGAMLPALAATATGGLSLLATPFTATAGGQIWDAFTRSVTGEEKPIGDIATDAGNEIIDNAIWDLASLGLGKVAKGTVKAINNRWGKTATMNRMAQSPEAFSGLVGQGIQQTNISEGGARQLAKVVDNLVESNVIFGKQFDPTTAKFVGEVGEETLEQMRDRLGKQTLTEVAQARSSIQKQLDDVMLNKHKLKPINSQHVDTSAVDDLINRLALASENTAEASYLAGIRDSFLDDLAKGRTFEDTQKLLQNQYDKLKALKNYDPALSAQAPPSQYMDKETQLRKLLAKSLHETIIKRADEISIAEGIKAPTGGTVGEYIDKLNDIYGGVKTLSEDIQSFITRQIAGGTGNRPASSFVQTDLSQLDPRSPLGSLWRKVAGGTAETVRRRDVFNQLDTTIPSDIRAIAKIRQFGPLTIPDGAGVIDPLRNMSFAAIAAAQASYREPKVMRRYSPDTITSLLQSPDISPDVQQSVARALMQAPSDTERKKIIGLAAKEFPEIGDKLEPSPLGLKSDFDGMIGDPNEKMFTSRDLSIAVRDGRESTIAAAKFKSALNADRPYTVIPKTLRKTEEVPSDLGMFLPNLGQ